MADATGAASGPAHRGNGGGRVTSPAELLDQILSTVGEAPVGGAVDLVGSDPVLPSPLRIGEAGAATIAAAGLMAARLRELRGGRPQAVRVEVDAAAAAMRSGRYLRPQSETPASLAEFRPR